MLFDSIILIPRSAGNWREIREILRGSREGCGDRLQGVRASRCWRQTVIRSGRCLNQGWTTLFEINGLISTGFYKTNTFWHQCCRLFNKYYSKTYIIFSQKMEFHWKICHFVALFKGYRMVQRSLKSTKYFLFYKSRHHSCGFVELWIRIIPFSQRNEIMNENYAMLFSFLRATEWCKDR